MVLALDFGSELFHYYVLRWPCILSKKSLKMPKGVIRIRKSKKNRQHKKKKCKRTNNDTQNTTQKTKDRATRTPLKIRDKLRCSAWVSSSCSTSVTRRVNPVTNPVISHEWGKDRKCLRQVEHIHGHLWHIYSITVHQVMVVTVRLSKWWFQLNQEVLLIQ